MILKYLYENNFIKIKNFIATKNFLILSCSLVFLLSIYINSVADIGSDSGIYLDIGRKFAQGGKYYDQIFESNFPLNFYIYALEYRISQFTKIHPILLSQICIYIFFFICLACCFRIVKKTTIYDDKIFVNLLFLFFFIGFFLRHPSIQHNDLGTKTTFFMLLFFPYLLYSLELKHKLSNKDLIYRGILMGLIPCFKPNYAIVVIAIELFKFFEYKNWRFIFRLDHLITLLVGLAMLDWMIFFEKEYFQFMVPMWRDFYEPYSDAKIFLRNITTFIIIIVLPIIPSFLVFLFPNLISKNLKMMFAIMVAFIVMLISEGLFSIDQLSILYFFTIFFLLFLFYNRQLIFLLNLRKNKFIIGSFLIFGFLEQSSIYFICYGLFSVFWSLWIIAPIYVITYFKRKILSIKDIVYFFIIYCLLLIIFYNLILTISCNKIIFLNIFFVILCAIFYEIKIKRKQSSFFSLLVVILLISLPMIIAFKFLTSVQKVFDDNSVFKSPSIYSDKIHYYLKKYTQNQEDQIMFFTFENAISFPLIKYINKDNLFKSSNQFFYIDARNSDVDSYFVDQFFNKELLQGLKDPNNKLFIIGSGFAYDNCKISLTEYFLRNSQFKKLLNKNFKFVDKINVFIKNDNFGRKLNVKGNDSLLISNYFLISFLEIYVRK